MIYIVLQPNTHYAGLQAALIFLLGGVTTGVLVGSEIANRLHMEKNGFVVTLVGSSAVTLLTAFALSYLAKPEEQIVAFYVEEQGGNPVLLSTKGAAEVRPEIGARELTTYSSNDTILVILSQQDSKVDILIRPNPLDPSIVHRGVVDRPPHARSRLRLVSGGKIEVVPFGG